MRQAVLYRLYPSTSQQRQLASILETPRRWYNTCLEARKSAYADEGRTVSKVEQLRTVKTSKATNPYAAPLHSHLLQGVVSDLDKAFHAFFRRVKAGEEPGYPRFKGRNRWRSVGFKEYGNGCKVDGRRVKVHGVGRLAVRWHRPIPGTVKTLRLLCKAGKWYAALSCVVDSAPLPSTGAEVGIDVGLASLLTTTDGDHIPHPAWYRHSQRALRVAGRRVSRRKKGGTNRRKAIHALQRVHERIANQRKDFLYKLSHRLLTTYERIALEDLRIANMVRNPHLAQSILDAGWGLLASHLMRRGDRPVAPTGRVVGLVNPRGTSKTCSQCGQMVLHLPLSQRVFRCPCGLSLDRDENAARNILRLGQSRWALSSPGGELAQEAAGL
jgi:putative transposase